MTVKEIFENLDYGTAPESPDLAKEWISKHGPVMPQYIGGEWVVADESFDSLCPATTEPLTKISQGSDANVDAAVKAARKASASWQKLSGFERARFLYAIARQIQKHSRLFSVLESLDNGKPIRETRDLDIPLVIRHFYAHAGWAQLLDREFPEYESVGVCGQIIPWNFPLLMLSWKIAPALAAGNTVVLKPAEFTSLTAILFAEICDSVGLPKGVVNIVTGDGRTGKAIVEHPDIDKVAFTGSTEVGRILRKATAGSGKKLSLELGGKSPFIVFADADLDGAVEGLVDAIWFNQGQVCCAGSRLLVQEGIADKFHKKVKARMEQLRLGHPLEKGIDIGAVVDKMQLERIAGLVTQGVEQGAELHQPSTQCPTSGWFYPPTLLTNVSPSNIVAQEEIFGPVLVSMTFRTHAEAIALANNTVYGLASSVWTENLNLAHDVASKIKAGTVWVNCSNQFDANCGFGGYRESGYGREGGKEGLYEYLKPKSMFGAPMQSKPVQPISTSERIDRTHKNYVGGKQARPDGGYSLTIKTKSGFEEVGRGNRKDIRNAVEAAESALSAWSNLAGHSRAQIIYYIAENLAAERQLFVNALGGDSAAEEEFDASLDRCFYYAAWADKYDGAVHNTPMRAVNYTRNEAIGSCGVVCPEERPLLGFLSTVLPLVSMGNTVVAIPSESNPIVACELYRVFDQSDLPGGVINIVTGLHSEVVPSLAEHDTLQCVWHFGDADTGKAVELASIGNLKQTWCSLGKSVDWMAAPNSEFLRRAVQVKNIWVPYGA